MSNNVRLNVRIPIFSVLFASNSRLSWSVVEIKAKISVHKENIPRSAIIVQINTKNVSWLKLIFQLYISKDIYKACLYLHKPGENVKAV